jgi:DsbC/DsbD-like thiol-disulfide interchange protein
MSSSPIKDGTEVSDEDFGADIPELTSHRENGVDVAPPTSHALFIIPTRQADGFRAGIHGHMLELADPTDRRLAPSPDDLLVASMAAHLAWSARSFLRAYRLPDYVSVSAKWQTGGPSVADITLTVTVRRPAKAVSAALAAALDNSLPARSLARPVVHISLEE